MKKLIYATLLSGALALSGAASAQTANEQSITGGIGSPTGGITLSNTGIIKLLNNGGTPTGPTTGDNDVVNILGKVTKELVGGGVSSSGVDGGGIVQGRIDSAYLAKVGDLINYKPISDTRGVVYDVTIYQVPGGVVLGGGLLNLVSLYHLSTSNPSAVTAAINPWLGSSCPNTYHYCQLWWIFN